MPLGNWIFLIKNSEANINEIMISAGIIYHNMYHKFWEVLLCVLGTNAYINKMATTDKLKESELNFKVLKPSDHNEIKEFLELYFFPEEPVSRSTKLLEGTGFINKYISSLVKRYMMDPCLKDGTSIAAYNKEGEIIGAKYVLWISIKNFLDTYKFFATFEI